MTRIFVTGMARSGTTLLARLLAGNGRALFNQPLPLLVPRAMTAWLQARGASAERLAYPVTDGQLGDHFEPEMLTEFLDGWRLTPRDAKDLLKACANFSGQGFKPDTPLAALDTWSGGTLAQFIAHYLSAHACHTATGWVMKELVGEGFLPSLASAGWTPVLAIRDPRTLIASMLTGHGELHVGKPRPIAFLARQWRQSALYALAKPCGLHPVRYEDAVADPIAALAGAGLPEANLSALERVANTSFRDAPREGLPPRTRRFVEALCFYEMRALGDTPQIGAEDLDAVLQDGPDHEILHRPALARYVWGPDRLAEEMTRLEALRDEGAGFDARLFIFEAALQALRAARP
jgi:hypothetical protein